MWSWLLKPFKPKSPYEGKEYVVVVARIPTPESPTLMVAHKLNWSAVHEVMARLPGAGVEKAVTSEDCLGIRNLVESGERGAMWTNGKVVLIRTA